MKPSGNFDYTEIQIDKTSTLVDMPREVGSLVLYAMRTGKPVIVKWKDSDEFIFRDPKNYNRRGVGR